MRPVRLLVTLAVFLTLASARSGARLAEGDVLSSSNWEEAKNLLPEEILAHYKRGEYRNTIVDLTRPGYLRFVMPPDFRAASEANRGRYDLSAEGSIVDAKTGVQPPFIMGFPFPDVTAEDPRAATKIVWNFFYHSWYRNGNSHFLTEIVLLNRTGIERSVRTDVHLRMCDGNPLARHWANPHNLLQQILARVTYPADLQGIISLTWRYRDPNKRDSLWTYVPGLRRPRQVSALNRSDGFMGSDLSIDDGSFFDGKPEDFTFRLLGRQDQLIITDPFSVRGETESLPVKGGGWRRVWKDVPRIGADAPEWKGLPWAPVSAVLARRPVWVVEAKPRDPNYLYGRIVLRFDAETYYGTWSSKYDRGGMLLNSYQVSNGVFYTPDGGKTYIPSGGLAGQTAENLLYERATVVLFPPRNLRNPADFRVPLAPDLFSIDALMRLGK